MTPKERERNGAGTHQGPGQDQNTQSVQCDLLSREIRAELSHRCGNVRGRQTGFENSIVFPLYPRGLDPGPARILKSMGHSNPLQSALCICGSPSADSKTLKPLVG